VGGFERRKYGAPIVLVPVDRWNAATEKALQICFDFVSGLQAVHVTCETDEGRPRGCGEAGGRIRVPKLVTLPSPFRLVVHPMWIMCEGGEGESRAEIAVVIASMVEPALVSLFSAQSARADADGFAAAGRG